ncbi:MAG: AAA family ATPase [Oscillospiraceae bacterium]
MPDPFIVLATQNPAGSAGTQMLPNSQLDRFLVKLTMGYPDFKSQVSILEERHTENPLGPRPARRRRGGAERAQSSVRQLWK